jgi:hypothetical protein
MLIGSSTGLSGKGGVAAWAWASPKGAWVAGPDGGWGEWGSDMFNLEKIKSIKGLTAHGDKTLDFKMPF